MSSLQPDNVPLRMMFELEREDNPALYDDLIRFKKGAKRVNRLRLLAHEGVLVQSLRLEAKGTLAMRQEPWPSSADGTSGGAKAVSVYGAEGIFDEPLTDD